jgi:hypothetical protein
MMNHSRRRIGPGARAAVAAASVLFVLSGCAAHQSNSADKKPAGGSSPAAAETQTVVSGDTGDLKDPKGAIVALSDFRCEPDSKGTWTGRGELANPGDATTRFLVTAAVIKPRTHQVLGSADKTYTLEAGAHQKVTLADVYTGTRDKVTCVPRVVSGQ